MLGKSKICFLLIIFFGMMSCKPIVKYPDEPALFFKTLNTQTLELVVDFTDGDGNFGLNNGDTQPPFDPTSIHHYNYYLQVLTRDSGKWMPNDMQITFRVQTNYPMPQPKAQVGSIIVRLEDFTTPQFFPDTFRMALYIYDRDLNKSNVDTTGIIVLRK